MFLFEKIDKNVQFKFLFEDWKSCPPEELSYLRFLLYHYITMTLEMREREAYRKQTGSNVSVLLNKVSALEHDRFMQVSLYTVWWLFANT